MLVVTIFETVILPSGTTGLPIVRMTGLPRCLILGLSIVVTPLIMAHQNDMAASSPWVIFQHRFGQTMNIDVGMLIGTWVETRSTAPHRAVDGRNGPDIESYDPSGLRRDDVDGHPYEWKLTIRSVEGQLEADSNSGMADVGGVSKVKLAPDGTALLFFDEGADEGPTEFRCRAASADGLLCMAQTRQHHDDDLGVEFQRLSTR